MRPPGVTRAIQASLAGAGDSQVAQIVALVDAMPQRGAADGLVAPLRPRLARLRPPRPIGFARLLFTPLDPLVVAAADWRRGTSCIPRTALTPIAQALRAILATEAAQIDSEGRRGAMTPKRLAELGNKLWPRAAAALESMPLPSGWLEATGLPDSDYRPLASAITAVLGVGGEIQTLTLQSEPPTEDAMRNILGRTAPRGEAALSCVVAILLTRLSGYGRIVALATEASGSNPSAAVDQAVQQTVDLLQDVLDADITSGATMAQAMHDAARVLTLLEELKASAVTRPDRARRLERLRRTADLLCFSRFEAALQNELMGRLMTLPVEPADPLIEALEATARGLLQLAAKGRALGGGDHYDVLLRGCFVPLQRPIKGLNLAERVRIVEILLGPTKALSLIR
jgi:hypothetical protein